jgi:hypothetical protein
MQKMLPGSTRFIVVVIVVHNAAHGTWLPGCQNARHTVRAVAMLGQRLEVHGTHADTTQEGR